MHVATGTFFAGGALRKKAGSHPHRAGKILDRELRVGGVVRSLEAWASGEV